MSERKIPGWVLPAGVVVLVAVLVVIALVRGPVALDPDTPEGTVQEYLLALSQGRYDEALEVVHEEWRGACEASDLEGFAQGDFSAELGNDAGFGQVREEFVGVAGGEEPPPTIPDDAVQVEVTIHHDPGAGMRSWSEFVVFELAPDDDFWWLVGDPWPHFVWSCRESL